MLCREVALGSEKAPTTSGKVFSVGVGGFSGETWVPTLETEGCKPLFSLGGSHLGKLRSRQKKRKTGTLHSHLL